MQLIIINSFPTSEIFGKKVDPFWYMRQGIDTEFWDLSPIYFSKNKLDLFYTNSENYKFIGPSHKVVHSLKEFESKVASKNNNKAIYWYLSRFDRMLDDDDIINVFNKNRAKYLFQNFDPCDSGITLLSLFHFHINNMKQKLLARNCKPLAIVTSGLIGRKQALARYPSTKVISIPSIKVLWNEVVAQEVSSYIVFVDECLMRDPDIHLHTQSLCSDVNSYYRRMRELFSFIEDNLSIPVIIGCSNKYRYVDPELIFGKRKVIYGKTLELLQHCFFAIGHLSLALDQLIISRKPVLIIDDQDFTRWRRKGFRDVKKRFRQEPILNTKVNKNIVNSILNRDISFYKEIESEYFREPDVDEDYKKIFLSELKIL